MAHEDRLSRKRKHNKIPSKAYLEGRSSKGSLLGSGVGISGVGGISIDDSLGESSAGVDAGTELGVPIDVGVSEAEIGCAKGLIDSGCCCIKN